MTAANAISPVDVHDQISSLLHRAEAICQTLFGTLDPSSGRQCDHKHILNVLEQIRDMAAESASQSPDFFEQSTYRALARGHSLAELIYRDRTGHDDTPLNHDLFAWSISALGETLGEACAAVDADKKARRMERV